MPGMNRRKTAGIQTTLLLWMLLSTGMLFQACTGPEGPAGEDAVGVDHVPPTVFLRLPEAGDTLSDTLTAVATALDEVGVQRVIFYLDGSDHHDTSNFSVEMNEESSQANYFFDFAAMGLSYGIHSFEARGVDYSYNVGTSPVILVHYAGTTAAPGDTVTLRYYHTPPSLAQTLLFADTSTVSDSLFNVRFQTGFPSELLALRVYLYDEGENDSYIYDQDLYVYVYHSNGAYPTNQLEEFSALGQGELTLPGWNEFVFAEGSRPTFAEGEMFHAALTTGGLSDTTHMAFTTDEREPYPQPVLNHSGLYSTLDTDRRWMTAEERYGPDLETTYEFHMEAILRILNP